MPINLYDMDLAGLIRRTKGDRSYEQLAASSPDSPSRQRWQQLGSMTFSPGLPEPRTVRAIAAALGVSDRVVVLAAARTAGLQVGEDMAPLATLLPPSADKLSDTQVSAVLAVIRAMLETPHAPPIEPTPTDEPPENLRPKTKDDREADELLRRQAAAEKRRGTRPKG